MKLKPYKIQVVHALHQPDANKRLWFCNWVLEKVNSGELDAKEIFYWQGMVLFTWTGVFTKVPVLQWLKNRESVWEQRQFDAPWGGGLARQGRELQQSVATRSIWMTLYLLRCISRIIENNIKLGSQHTEYSLLLSCLEILQFYSMKSLWELDCSLLFDYYGDL